MIARGGQPLAQRLSALGNLDLREVSPSLLSSAMACRGLTLVHAHDGRSVHAAALAQRLFDVPYIVTRRVAVALKQSFLTRRSYQRAARVAVLSAAIEQQVHKLDRAIACVRVPDAHADLPVDTATVAQLEQRYHGRFVIGHIGALDDTTKGQRDLFAVAREVQHSHPDMHFVFLGDGPDADAFAAETADLPNVEFAGHVDNVGDHLAVFDAFAFPSRHEGLGSTLLDAMHAAVPVVASDVGGIVDLVRDHENGILVPSRVPDALGAALVKLRDDSRLRARLGAAGQQHSREYSPDRMVERYLEIYAPMLANDPTAEPS